MRGTPFTPRAQTIICSVCAVTPATEEMVLCALGVKGVPRISLEEALWCAAETLYT